VDDVSSMIKYSSSVTNDSEVTCVGTHHLVVGCRILKFGTRIRSLGSFHEDTNFKT